MGVIVKDFSKYFYTTINIGEFYLCLDTNIILLVSKHDIAHTDFNYAKNLLKNLDIPEKDSCVVCWSKQPIDIDPMSLWETAEDRFVLQTDVEHFEELLLIIMGSIKARYTIKELTEIIDCFYDPPDHLSPFVRELVNLGVGEALACELAAQLPTDVASLYEMGVPYAAVPAVQQKILEVHKDQDEDNEYKGTHFEYAWKSIFWYALSGVCFALGLVCFLFKYTQVQQQAFVLVCMGFSFFFFLRGYHYFANRILACVQVVIGVCLLASVLLPAKYVIVLLVKKLLSLTDAASFDNIIKQWRK